MKSTTFIALLLTLLMLLLVTGAAALFLWQGHRDLQSDVTRLELEVEGQMQEMNNLQTTAAAREMVIATAQAQATVLAAQAAEAEALLATREAELAEALATPAATARPTAGVEAGNGPPRLEILYPAFGTTIASDVNVLVIVIAAAEEGIASIEVQAGDRPPLSELFDDGETFAVFRRSFFNLEPGPRNITATLTTADGVSEETSIRIFVSEAQTDEN